MSCPVEVSYKLLLTKTKDAQMLAMHLLGGFAGLVEKTTTGHYKCQCRQQDNK